MRITLCGSTKFKKQYEEINKLLTLQGHIVYTVAFFSHADNIPITDEEKKILDKVHLDKIDNSEAIYVIDVDGYIGESTKNEILHAQRNLKGVFYLSNAPHAQEPFSYVDGFIDSIEKIIKLGEHIKQLEKQEPAQAELTHENKIHYMRIASGMAGFALHQTDMDLLVSMYEMVLGKKGDGTIHDAIKIELEVTERHNKREAEKEMEERKQKS